MEQSAELVDLARRLYAMFSSGDTSVAEETVDERAIVIGTDPAEWWEGRDDVLRALRAQVKELTELGARVEAGAIKAYSDGGFGWMADRPAFVMPDGSRLEGRLTAVFRRDGGTWKIVQWHVSVGVANQETIGAELTV